MWTTRALDLKGSSKVDFIHGIDDPANVAPVAGPGAHNAGLDMLDWKRDVIMSAYKRAIPVLSFPSVQPLR